MEIPALPWEMLIGLLRKLIEMTVGRKNEEFNRLYPTLICDSYAKFLEIDRDYRQNFLNLKNVLLGEIWPSEELIAWVEDKKQTYQHSRNEIISIRTQIAGFGPAWLDGDESDIAYWLRQYLSSLDLYFVYSSELYTLTWYSRFIEALKYHSRMCTKGNDPYEPNLGVADSPIRYVNNILHHIDTYSSAVTKCFNFMKGRYASLQPSTEPKPQL